MSSLQVSGFSLPVTWVEYPVLIHHFFLRKIILIRVERNVRTFAYISLISGQAISLPPEALLNPTSLGLLFLDPPMKVGVLLVPPTSNDTRNTEYCMHYMLRKMVLYYTL